MPPKVTEIVAELEQAGFVERGGQAVTETLSIQKVAKSITISGALGDDAKHYQIRAVKRAIQESKT